MRAQAYRHGFLHGTCVPAEERSSIAARSLVAKVMTVVLVSRVVFRVAVARVAGSAAPNSR